MPEQRNIIKAADLVTSSGVEGDTLVDAILLPVDGGRAKVFGLFSITYNDPSVRDVIARILRAHLDHGKNAMTGDANIARRFEAMLADCNASLAEMGNVMPRIPITAFDAIVGVVTENQLFASGLGGLSALFLHKTADRRFVIYELHAQFRAETESSWEKPFITILDGEIHPGDIFYLATRTPAQTISITDLQDILITLPPAGALQRIRQFLPHDAVYGALCFAANEDDQSGPPKKINPIASLTQLGTMKNETADLLGEQGTDITGAIRRTVAAISGKLAAPGSRGYKSMLKKITRLVVHILGVLLVAIVAMIKIAVRLLLTLVQRIFDASKKSRGTSGSALTSTIARRVERIRMLPRQSKYIIGGIVCVVVILIGSIVFMGHQSARKQAETAFQSAASRVEEKTSAADASLIYNDTDKAFALLTEAAALLDTLQSDSKAHTSRVDGLRNALTALQAKIRKVTIVEPSIIAELSTDEAGLATLTNVNGTLYALAIDGDLFRVNELEHTIVKEGASNGTASGIHTSTEEGANMLFVDSSSRLSRVDTAAKTMHAIASGVDGIAGVEDIVRYNDALYVLSAASQQIVKMRPQGDGYEAGTTWISARSSDLTKAREIAIDGNMYVLTANDIVQFKSGHEVTWNHDAIAPALTNPVDIWTSLESKYLYILDAGEGRVIVYNKESGDIVTQYSSDALKNSVGLVVREGDKQILVATSAKVMTFTTTHLLQ